MLFPVDRKVCKCSEATLKDFTILPYPEWKRSVFVSVSNTIFLDFIPL
jgi:hypothetical protein